MSANAVSSAGGGASSDLKSQVIKHCTWDAVIPAPPLEELATDRIFRIMSYDVTTFNSFNVMEKENEDELFRLREEIFEVVEDGELTLKEDPYIGEIVLAPNPGFNNEYQRAFIEKINYAAPNAWNLGETTKESNAMVYFFDSGGLHRVKLIKMKPVTKPIMKFPVLSYKIALYTGEVRNGTNSSENGAPFSSEGLIYFKKFDKIMEALKKEDITVQVELEELKYFMFHSTDLFNVYPAQLFYTRKGRKCSVAKRFEREKIWEWEHTLTDSSDQLDDNSLFEKGSYGIVEDDREISTYQLSCNAPGGFEFTAQVSRIMKRESETSSAEVRVILLDDPIHINYRNVVHNQMERYAKTVNKSIYNPAIGTRFMFKLDRKEEYVKLGIKRLDGWCRAIKLDADWIYLFDWDDSVHMRGLDSDDYDIRPLYGEFVQIPTLVVNICPFVNGRLMSHEKTKSELRLGQRYKFKVSKYIDFEDLHDVEFLGPVVVGGVSQGPMQLGAVSSDSDSDTTSSSTSEDNE